jgi:3-hydroxybutyryl-CoA dehydrogenase
VELIRGLQTSDATDRGQARQFVDAPRQISIIVQNSPGFVVNRILCPMINESDLRAPGRPCLGG